MPGNRNSWCCRYSTISYFIFGSQLRNLEKSSTANTVDAIPRKGIRWGLGLRWRDSLCECLGNWMINASVRIRTVQALSLKQSLDSSNNLVRVLSRILYKDKLPFADVNTNFLLSC